MSLFAKFNLEITIDDDNHSSPEELRSKYPLGIEDKLLNSNIDENQSRPYATIEKRITDRINLIARQYEIQLYIADFGERNGSLVLYCLLFLETAKSYNEMRDALDRIEDDLYTILKVPKFHIKVNIRGQIPASETRVVNTHGVIGAYIRLAIMLVALGCAVFLAVRYLNEENKSQKIEVTIKNDGKADVKVLGADTVSSVKPFQPAKTK